MMVNAFDIMAHLNLSAHVYHRILKLDCTIVDLVGSDAIQSVHLAEALHLRQADVDDGISILCCVNLLPYLSYFCCLFLFQCLSAWTAFYPQQLVTPGRVPTKSLLESEWSLPSPDLVVKSTWDGTD